MTAENHWFEICRPAAPLGQVRHALFDFDGTLSTIRCGWEAVMAPMMVEMICGDHPPEAGIIAEVNDYIDRSTGTLTIKQMQWLAQAVERHGLAGPPRSPAAYKRIYNQRLLDVIYRRSPGAAGVLPDPERYMVAGARSFLQGLVERGVQLYLASGTDLVYVRQEAAALGLHGFFGRHIYGADGESEDDSKERVIERLLAEHRLEGPQLLVTGDGPVEIAFARQAGALALGVASDEERGGINERKRQRLITAGADLLVADFRHAAELIQILAAP